QQGVAIVLMAKLRSRNSSSKVYHAEKWGLRESKYTFLRTNELKTAKHKSISPSSPNYFFVPKSETNRRAYEEYAQMNGIFIESVNGIVTARDSFVIDFRTEELRERLARFRDMSLDDAAATHGHNLRDTRGWKLSVARKKLATDSDWETHFCDILYRPFDIRKIYYSPTMVDWGRWDLMRHFSHSNLCLVCPKRLETQLPWSHILASSAMIDHVTVSLKTVDYCFPMYLYPDASKHDLFSSQKPGTPEANISQKLTQHMSLAYKKSPCPELIFGFIYGILHSNAYRTKYSEFLRNDFPRVPFTTDYALFLELAEKGQQLIDLHLLKSKKLEKPISKCEGTGEQVVIKPTYEAKRQRVYINKEKYFTGVAAEVWNYHIGGYQVAEKWLKDRRGRTLTSEEASTYTKIITALSETIAIQSTLDPLFEQVENSLLEVKL
ncbi:MAG: type ISP restriction/modification enzyme, partial [Candidatus Zixiibacteriota bacterium]